MSSECALAGTPPRDHEWKRQVPAMFFGHKREPTTWEQAMLAWCGHAGCCSVFPRMLRHLRPRGDRPPEQLQQLLQQQQQQQ
eukprot:CAMPEP_0172835970 /NCGR_PEP_ID=MMETSP1075-20121228/26157_1 /TAXON_ID=2916 /ORGANISM="Ceratium fusus, Strain PA161109" /LENGTH=81 /DNA_ID=CAMNT_0013679121 /DNA_START=986 /DNA_END=1228 /DNA_ORIENTATION=+